jgi:RNA recognition motif-containing protein
MLLLCCLDGVKYMTLPFVSRASAEKCRLSMSGYILDNFPLKVVWHQESTLQKVIQACQSGPVPDMASPAPPALEHSLTEGSRSDASTTSASLRSSSRSVSDYSPSSLGGSPGEMRQRMPIKGLPSIHVKFEISDPVFSYRIIHSLSPIF